MVVSIHQPHYFLSFVQIKKIIQSDKFVFFDDVQIPQGKSVVHRAKLKYNNDFKWINISKSKNNSSKLIKDINKLDNNYIEEHIAIIENYYRKSNTRDWLVDLLKKTSNFSKISEINIFLTENILDYLGFNDIELFKSSELCKDKDYDSTIEKIIDINKNLNTTIYLTGNGPGSMRYMDEKLFQNENIKIEYFNFEHPVYKQAGKNFIKDLSVIDLLCNEEQTDAKNILLHSK